MRQGKEVARWITARFNTTQICSRDLSPAKNFFLLWNIFEGKVTNGGNFTINCIQNFCRNQCRDIAIDYNPTLQYFQNRYVTGQDTNTPFANLNIRRRNVDVENDVRNVLLGNATTNADRLYAILVIAYRIRNHAFHGVKELPEVAEQKATFICLNYFLMKLLDNFPP